jgi:hypothetical protein
MEIPGADSLMETVRLINRIGKANRSAQSNMDEYLDGISLDPITEWFTDLLREKTAELDKERERADRVANALSEWYGASHGRISDGSASEADVKLAEIIRGIGIGRS